MEVIRQRIDSPQDLKVRQRRAQDLLRGELEGKDLENLSNERGPLPPAEVVWLLSQVAVALDRVHLRS